MPKNHEFRFDVRVFARVKSQAAAEKLAAKLNEVLKGEMEHLTKYSGSWTGCSVQVEDLEKDKGLDIIKRG